MVKLITVHGTFTSASSSEGSKWWQKGSPFVLELQTFIGEDVQVEPFHWSGSNSEPERRKYGNRLCAAIGSSP